MGIPNELCTTAVEKTGLAWISRSKEIQTAKIILPSGETAPLFLLLYDNRLRLGLLVLHLHCAHMSTGASRMFLYGRGICSYRWPLVIRPGWGPITLLRRVAAVAVQRNTSASCSVFWSTIAQSPSLPLQAPISKYRRSHRDGSPRLVPEYSGPFAFAVLWYMYIADHYGRS